MFSSSHSVKTYKTNMDDSVPGMTVLFEKAAELCDKNPNFKNSIIITLLKGAIAKEQFGSNAKTEEEAVNFYRYMRTYDPKSSEVLATLLGGPGARWCKKLNARERDCCILDSGKDGEKVVERMIAAIKRRSNGDGKMPSFSLAIDATKVASVLEASSGYQAILGGAHPSHLIDIKNKTKYEVRDILDGKSKNHGKIELATEIKVCSFFMLLLLLLLCLLLANMLPCLIHICQGNSHVFPMHTTWSVTNGDCCRSSSIQQ
jgi:hypothetical protein